MIINTAEELINQLENLKKKDETYIFRGQPNKDFFLQPKVFRPDGIEQLIQEFPFTPYQEWCSSKIITEQIALCSNNGWSINNWEPRRLVEITFYEMWYNYKLANYVKKFYDRFDKQTIALYDRLPPQYWTLEETFQRGFYENLDQALGIITSNGTVIKYSSFSEILTISDESLPQHYGVPTAALDWTRDPYIAIYFATQNIPTNATFFSVFVYKEVQARKENQILIKHGHPDIVNPRIDVQKGVFTCFLHPCSFYFFNGRWPCLEDYLPISQQNFEIIRYDVPVNQSKNLVSFLNKKGITKEYLLLDDASDLVPSTAAET